MKRTLAILWTIFLLLPLFPAAAQETSAPAMGPIRLGGKGDDSANRGNVLPLSNGNLLLSISTHRGRNGQETTKSSNAWVWLVCLKPDGSILWETEFGEARGSLIFVNLLEQPDQTVIGYLHYSIEQHSQYRQKRVYSLMDGKLLWQGEQEPTTDKDVYVDIQTAGSRYLRKETHDAQATCKPRFYQLEETDGTVVWRADAESIGLNNLRGVLDVPQGTLLYGNQWEDGASGGTAKALVMDDAGKVLWTKTAEGWEDGDLMQALPAGKDQALFSGLGRGPLNSKAGGFAYRDVLLLLLDTGTGGVIWRRQYPDGEQAYAPTGAKLKTQSGFLLASIDRRDHTGILYQAIGLNGAEQARWQTTFKDTAILGAELIHWGGSIWVKYTMEQDGDMDVVLERVAMPEQSQ